MEILLVAALCFLSLQGLRSAPAVRIKTLSGRQGELVVVRDSVLDHGKQLVVLRASANSQGNYSCILGNSTCIRWFNLTVSPTEQNGDFFPRNCFQRTSCDLKCPVVYNIPSLNLTETVWYKDKSRVPLFRGSFRSVEKEDAGDYTCKQSYRHHGQLYNDTRTTRLQVTSNKHQSHSPVIRTPSTGTVYPVQLGSQLVVSCVAVVYNVFDGVYWLHGRSFVEVNQSLSVYYNTTEESSDRERTITVSLVFQKVTEDQLSGNYTCKLESTLINSQVSISLALKVPLAVGLAVLFILLVVISVLVFLRWRVHITLVMRDTLGCHVKASDGKRYDVYVMTYRSRSHSALSEEDRRWMETVLEDRLGYRLCLHERDAFPGEAVADAVMRGILQSRRVLLVPSLVDHPDPAGLGSGLPSAIHAALVDKKSRLVLILSETTQEKDSKEEEVLDGRCSTSSFSLPESLRLLTQAGSSVTWGGPRSRYLSSSFWKHLRYRLPAPRKLRAVDCALDPLC
ncbi:hypothetical protein NHX12_005460 [Muraenolepis orangiensis]|uniref:Uncharacterized protein n=1 Tax=Muraenolepis orangiensis TaxID=630683 RepID=A0A9Q0DRK1_9TELE|nr:hypothetical protein NHX12_005460 [Muraenolepis orangiensis]